MNAAPAQLNKKMKYNFWKAHYDKQRASGLNSSAYCRGENLNISVYKYWVAKFRDAHTSKLIPVKVISDKNFEENNAALCTIYLKEGVRMLVHDHAAFEYLIGRL